MNSLTALFTISALAISLASPSGAELAANGKGSCQVKLDLLTSSSVFNLSPGFQKLVTAKVEGKVDELMECTLPSQCSTSCFSIGTAHGTVNGCKLLLAFPCLAKAATSCEEIDLKDLVGKSISTSSGPVYIIEASAEPYDASWGHGGCAAPSMLDIVPSNLFLQPL